MRKLIILFTVSMAPLQMSLPQSAFAFDDSDVAAPLHETTQCLAKKIQNSHYGAEAAHCAASALILADRFNGNWDAGNAQHKAYLVRGMIALKAGDLVTAAESLLISAQIDGSPQLDTFGPNMTLAAALLQKGAIQPVLAYLEKCKSFWEDSEGKLSQWIQEIHNGQTPDFGANLHY